MKEIKITRLDSSDDDHKVSVPGTATYNAVVKDQFGGVMTGQQVSWAIDPYAMGVSVDRNGKVTAAANAEKADTFLTASVGTVKASVKLEIDGQEYKTISGLQLRPTAVKEGTSQVKIVAKYVDSYGSVQGDAADAVYNNPVDLSGSGTPTMDGATLTFGGSTSVQVSGYSDVGTTRVTGQETVNVVPADTPSAATWIDVKPEDGSKVTADGKLTAPVMEDADTPGKTTAKFLATVYDQFGAEMKDAPYSWSIQDKPAGISIDPDGLLTLTSTAKPGRYLVTATAPNNAKGTYTLTVERDYGEDGPTFTFLKVEDVILNDSDTQGDLTVKFLDEYGDEMAADPAFAPVTGATDVWTQIGATPADASGVSVTESADQKSATVVMGTAKTVTLKADVRVGDTDYTATGHIGYRSASIPTAAGVSFTLHNESGDRDGAVKDTITLRQQDESAEDALQPGETIRVYARGDSELSFHLVAIFEYDRSGMVRTLDTVLPVEGGDSYITRQGDGMESDPYPATMDVRFNAEPQVYCQDYLAIESGAGSSLSNCVVVPKDTAVEDAKQYFPKEVKVVSATGSTFILGRAGTNYYVNMGSDTEKKLVRITSEYLDELWAMAYTTDNNWRTTKKLSILLPDVVDKNGEAVISQPNDVEYTAYFHITESDKQSGGTQISRIEEPRHLHLTAGSVNTLAGALALVDDVESVQFYVGENTEPEDVTLPLIASAAEIPAGDTTAFAGWKLQQSTDGGVTWTDVADDEAAATALGTAGNSVRLIACAAYSDPYTMDPDNYQFAIAPVSLYNEYDPDNPELQNPLQLTEGNSALWKEGNLATIRDEKQGREVEPPAHKELTRRTAGGEESGNYADYRTDVIFFYLQDSYMDTEELRGTPQTVKTYIDAGTAVESVQLTGGGTLTSTDLDSWTNATAGEAKQTQVWTEAGTGRTLKVEQFNADGTTIAIQKYDADTDTELTGETVDYIEPRNTKAQGNYFVSGTAGSIKRYVEHYIIRYTLTDGKDTYVAERKVKLRYVPGDSSGDARCNSTDVSYTTIYGLGGTRPFAATEEELAADPTLAAKIAELNTGATEFNGDGLGNSTDVAPLTQYGLGGSDLPNFRW